LEGQADTRADGVGSAMQATRSDTGFRDALSQVWAEPATRRFTVFVFVSMLAYSSQDLILEPFAGTVFGYTPGESTQLSGVQHSGVLLGMVSVAVAGGGTLGRWLTALTSRRAGQAPAATTALVGRLGSLHSWTVGGCLASAVALLGLVIAGFSDGSWPLKATVFLLGVANGAFSIAAIGSMMGLAAQGGESREGVRMGLWGAAQAVAFGLGGLIGTAASDLARWWFGNPGVAYSAVFGFEAALFVLAAWLALRSGRGEPSASSQAHPTSAQFPTLALRRDASFSQHRVGRRESPRSATLMSPP
jgi:MFS transporter, BCD family, chlorophyll transporter